MKALFLVLTTLALPASAQNYIGMVSAIDVNAVCGLDGPKIDKDKVRDVYWAALYDDGQPRTGGYKVPTSHKAGYCHAARVVGLKAWSNHFSKEAKGWDISVKNTKELSKLTRLYSELVADGSCRETGLGQADKETAEELRAAYVKPVSAYFMRPLEKAMMGMGKATTSRQDALGVLAAVDEGHSGACAKALKAEREAIVEATDSSIRLGDAKK